MAQRPAPRDPDATAARAGHTRGIEPAGAGLARGAHEAAIAGLLQGQPDRAFSLAEIAAAVGIPEADAHVDVQRARLHGTVEGAGGRWKAKPR